MALALWVYFIIRLWIFHIVNSSRLLDVARMHCPNSDFCTVPRANTNFTATNKLMPCCSPCTCDESCWKLDNCCPDTDIARTPASRPYSDECTNTRFEYNTKCDGVCYLDKQPYRIISSCPKSYDEKIILNKCVNSTMSMPDSYDDIVVVSEASDHDVIFMNKYCAMCNGVHQTLRWNLEASFCRTTSLPETELAGPDLYKFTITECSLDSVPPDSLRLTSRALCLPFVISRCNVTGQWDQYDEIIDRACSDFYLLYFIETFFNIHVYKNVFCYHCNHVAGTVATDSVCDRDLGRTRSALLPTFSALLDTSINLAALEARHSLANMICAISEVYDRNRGVCRKLHCPINSHAFNGRCIPNSLEAFNLGVRLQLTFVPIKPVIVHEDDDISVERIGDDVWRMMQLMRCKKYTAKMLVNTSNNGRALQSVTFELAILTNHVCQLDDIEASITIAKQIKLLDIATKRTSISTTVSSSYKYLRSSNQDIISHEYGKLGLMEIYELTPVFFCPYVVLNETEYAHYLHNAHTTSSASSSIFFKIDKTKVEYATCVENVLLNSNSGSCQCHSLSIYLNMVLAAIVSHNVIVGPMIGLP